MKKIKDQLLGLLLVQRASIQRVTELQRQIKITESQIQRLIALLKRDPNTKENNANGEEK